MRGTILAALVVFGSWQGVFGQAPNDTCETATVVMALPFTATTQTDAATDDMDTDCNGSETATRAGVWYAYTPAADCVAAIRAESEGAQAAVAVFAGGCAGLEPVFCNGFSSQTTVELTGGTTYLVLVAPWSDDPPAPGLSFDVFIDCAGAPANDLCESATAVTPSSSTPGSNLGATGFSITPCAVDGADVWYSLSVPVRGVYTVTVAPTGAPQGDLAAATIKAYDACNGAELACLYGPAGDALARVDLLVDPGAPVLVRVAGASFNPERGRFVLQVSGAQPVPPAPSNDGCGSAQPLTTIPFFASVGNGAAADDIDVGCNEADGDGAAVRNGVWYSYTPAADCVLEIRETGAQETVAAVFTGGCGSLAEVACMGGEGFAFRLTGGTAYRILVGRMADSPAPILGTLELSFDCAAPLSNDECAGAAPMSVPGSTSGTTAGATTGPTQDCFGTRDVWFAFTAPITGEYSMFASATYGLALSAYEGCEGGALACVGSDSSSPLTFFTTAGAQVRIRVASADNQTGGFTLEAFPPTPPPSNDDCANPEPLAIGSTFGSTTASGGTDVTPGCGFEDTKDVWYSFVAPGAGYYTFDLRGQAFFDTTLAVFADCERMLLCGGTFFEPDPSEHSRVSVALGAGERVLVRVAGIWSATGSFQLEVSGPASAPPVPASDACAGAIQIGSDDFETVVDPSRATPDLDTDCNDPDVDITAYGIWLRYAASQPGIATLTERSGQYVTLAALRGSCGAPVVAGCTSSQNSVSAGVAEGETLYFLVGTARAEFPGAPYDLQFSFTPAVGACCVASGCVAVTENDCEAQGGVWRQEPCGLAETFNATAGLPLALVNPTFDEELGEVIVHFAESPVTVGANFPVANLAVRATIAHEWSEDVLLRLIAPNGTVIPLSEGSGFVSLNGAYVFSDAGLVTIGGLAGSEAAPGVYRASDESGQVVDLGSQAAGLPSAGTWKLVAGDRGSDFEGVISSWSLTLYRADQSGCGPACRADFDNQNGVQVADIFAFLRAWFANAPSADFDGMNGIQVADIFAFLRAWFAGC